jgi:VWFA-related protein
MRSIVYNSNFRRWVTAFLLLALLQFVAVHNAVARQAPVSAGQPAVAADQSSTTPHRSKSKLAGYTFKSQSDLVLVNVVARDRKGNPVRDLKPEELTVLEDGKPQRIASFDLENMATQAAGPEQANLTGPPLSINLLTSNTTPTELHDRRLLVLFFDFGSMQPDESQRAIDAARAFVTKQMTPSDLVAIVSYSTSLQVVRDFTTDRESLTGALKGLSAAEGEGLALGATGDTEGQPDTGAEYTPDDTEYNIFNTDMRLQAIASLAEELSRVQQRKSVLYFSSGLTKTGVDNQTQLRQAINTAVRSNMALYPVDIRGLQALPPGGNATVGSLRGTSTYSGASIQSDLDSNFASQETLVTIASDTGGKAFLDSNDFSKAFTGVLQDTESYYVLGYRSTNRAMDGHYRHITVKVKRADVKLEYRAGYYGPRDFPHFTREDRARQMEDEIAAEMPNTDLPVYLSAGYFRIAADKYFVGVSLVVPGSAIPFTTAADKDKASIDVLGLVREQRSKAPVGNAHETVKFAADSSRQVRSKNIQYETGFLLPPGTYVLKFAVRENQNGKMGSFETTLTIPDLRKAPLKMSSVVLSSQKLDKPKSPNPVPLLPNVAHVFSGGQPLYLYYEVYEPASKPDVHLLTSIQFFSGKVKAYETPLVEAKELNTPQRKAVAFEMEVPLAKLRPGWYTCQVNVIDDAGGTFAFPRLPIYIRNTAVARGSRKASDAQQAN